MTEFPQLIVHADWSVHQNKRWSTYARLNSNDHYVVEDIRPVDVPQDFIDQVKHQVNKDANVLIGFDFPIGLPNAYAQIAGIDNFLAILPEFGKGKWGNFYKVANIKEEIHIYRPFYPQKPENKSLNDLLEQLHLSKINDLRRRCEDAYPRGRAASPLFWTLGAQQVGKAAMNGWNEVITPAISNPHMDIAIWPFSGRLKELMRTSKTILVETYPSMYLKMILPNYPKGRFSKRSQNDRLSISSYLLEWTKTNYIHLKHSIVDLIQNGFGSEMNAEDKFDSFIGLCGMISIITKWNEFYEPKDNYIRNIEGWILGRLP